MPSFIVKSEIRHGKIEKGVLVSTVYPPGSKIELSVEEAVAIAHAIENAPVETDVVVDPLAPVVEPVSMTDAPDTVQPESVVEEVKTEESGQPEPKVEKPKSE